MLPILPLRMYAGCMTTLCHASHEIVLTVVSAILMLTPGSSQGNEPKVISLEPPAVTNLFNVQRYLDTATGLVWQNRTWILDENLHGLSDRLLSTNVVVSLEQITEKEWSKADPEHETIYNQNGTFVRSRGSAGWERALTAVVVTNHISAIGRGVSPAITNLPLGRLARPAHELLPTYSPVFDIDATRRSPDAVWSRGKVSWKSISQSDTPVVTWELEFNPETRLKTLERVWRDGHLIREERWQTDAIIDSNQFEISEGGGDQWRTPMPVSVLHAPLAGFGGIGVLIGEKYGPFKVLDTIDGSPAQGAGIQTGDMIRGVNGMNLDGIPVTPFVFLCRGKAGTLVTLDVEKSGTGERKRVELRRAELKVNSRKLLTSFALDTIAGAFQSAPHAERETVRGRFPGTRRFRIRSRAGTPPRRRWRFVGTAGRRRSRLEDRHRDAS